MRLRWGVDIPMVGHVNPQNSTAMEGEETELNGSKRKGGEREEEYMNKERKLYHMYIHYLIRSSTI